MEYRHKLARLMKLSWAIQRNRRNSRSKALQSAWAIVANEDLTVSYLTRRLNHHRPVSAKAANQYGLFQ